MTLSIILLQNVFESENYLIQCTDGIGERERHWEMAQYIRQLLVYYQTIVSKDLRVLHLEKVQCCYRWKKWKIGFTYE